MARPDVRLRMSVYVSAQDVVQSVTQLSHVESSLFQCAGRCEVSRQRKVAASALTLRTYTVLHTREAGRGGWRTLKTETSCKPCSVGSLVSLVLARAVLCVRETWRDPTCGCA